MLDSRQAAPPLLKVLLLEDTADDATLLIRELTKGRVAADTRWVRDREEYLAALETPPDIVLSDYRLPGYGGLAALTDLKARWPDCPLVLISGALGDEAAAECIKAGAADYLLKDRLSRLPAAVANAVSEGRLRAERKAAEERLRQSQKMEAVGLLAGGIAHDFNNLLTAINGWVELLLDSEPVSERTSGVLREVAAAGDRAMRLTQQLLLFSRKRAPQREPVELNALIGNLAEMLRRLLGETVELELDLDAGLAPLEADPGMLEQAIVNLVVNGRDAMPKGGTIRIETAPSSRRPGAAGAEPAPGAAFVRLTVRDQGCGIPPEVQPRIFEPFFTTKEAGRGTGMGLSTVFAIVQQHQGWIEVESRVGQGTAFHLHLPAARSRLPAPAAPAPVSPRERTRTGETILVVEDEGAVRGLLVSALSRAGYRVIAAEDSRRAIEAWRQHTADIALLITDVVMPGPMNGFQLAEALRAGSSELPVLLTSGYHEEMSRMGRIAAPNTRFLHKPYAVNQLAAAVRQLLDEAPTVRLR